MDARTVVKIELKFLLYRVFLPLCISNTIQYTLLPNFCLTPQDIHFHEPFVIIITTNCETVVVILTMVVSKCRVSVTDCAACVDSETSSQ